MASVSERQKILCQSNGGYGSPRGHQCSCNRQAGHPLDSARPHGCSCGASWSCPYCENADPYMGCAECGSVGSPGDDRGKGVWTAMQTHLSGRGRTHIGSRETCTSADCQG